MASACVPLILGSASSARLATLQQAGVSPYVLVSDVDEVSVLTLALSRYGELAPQDVALVLARAKCEAVSSVLTSQSCRALLIAQRAHVPDPHDHDVDLLTRRLASRSAPAMARARNGNRRCVPSR